RRAHRRHGGQAARPLRGGAGRRLRRPRRAGPLRLRLRHGLPRAGPQPAGRLRVARGRRVSGAVLGVIGGTGVYGLAAPEDVGAPTPGTPAGAPSGPVRIGTLAGHRVAFLARHGEGHALPPHRINYRANLAALQAVGVARVLALNTVGGITDRYRPRALSCPDQLIDYTWGRVSTICEEPGSEVVHVDFGEPYTASLRRAVLAAAEAAGVPVVDGGCYGATQGPRLETRAEIARMRRDGCDLVGMTGMPEA